MFVVFDVAKEEVLEEDRLGVYPKVHCLQCFEVEFLGQLKLVMFLYHVFLEQNARVVLGSLSLAFFFEAFLLDLKPVFRRDGKHATAEEHNQIHY